MSPDLIADVARIRHGARPTRVRRACGLAAGVLGAALAVFGAACGTSSSRVSSPVAAAEPHPTPTAEPTPLPVTASAGSSILSAPASAATAAATVDPCVLWTWRSTAYPLPNGGGLGGIVLTVGANGNASLGYGASTPLTGGSGGQQFSEPDACEPSSLVIQDAKLASLYSYRR